MFYLMIGSAILFAGIACFAAEALSPVVGKCYGYVRVSTDKQALSPEVQRAHIEQAAQRLGVTVHAWFQDAPAINPDGSWNDAASGKVPLPERKAGRELCACLKRGDLVIAAKVDRAFRKLSDCVIMLDRWEKLGVGLLLCDFPMLSDLTNPFGKAMIQIVAVFAEIERKLISQRTKEALALRKRKGQAHSRYPGYGRRWERRWDSEQQKFVKFKVADPDERRVMREIVRWKLEGLGWDSITLQLGRQKILTKYGKPWSRSRIIRAFHAELALQTQENRITDG
jgi:DNA invertase Pin-like site-specific DNA recombinase